MELVEQRQSQPVALAPASSSPAAIMQLAIQQGAPVETIERMWALQVAYEKREAERKFNEAFAAFKAHAVRVIKNRQVTDGPLKNKKYAELFAVVNAVTPALSEHGLSASWKLTKDEKDWIEITCVLKHSGGHSESVAMGGPPDAGGAKNAIQQRASTVSYLERYTLKAILGVSEQEDDDDGGRGAEDLRFTWMTKVNEATNTEDLNRVVREGVKVLQAARDVEGYSIFQRAVTARREDFKAEAGA